VGEAVASPAAPAAAEVEALAAREGRLAEEVDVLRQALADAAQEAEDHLQALADARERAERVADLEAERDALREEAASIPDLEAELDRLRAMLDAVRVPAAREDLAEDEDDDEDDLPAALRGHDEEITAQRTRPFTPLEIADAVEGPEDDAPPPRRPAGPRPAVPERGAWEDEIAALPGPSGSAFATSEHDAIDPEAGGGRDGGAGPAFLRAVRGATAVRPRREDGEADGTAPGGAVLTKLRELLAPPPVADGAATRRPARRATTDRSRAASPARDVAEARRAALAARRLATQSGRRPTGTGRAPATAEDSWAARGVAILVVVLLLVALLVIVSAIA
jgi:hypothetical protein